MRKILFKHVLIIGLICFICGATAALWLVIGVFTRMPGEIIALTQISIDKLVDILLAVLISVVFVGWYEKRKEVYDRLYTWTSSMKDELESMVSTFDCSETSDRLVTMERMHFKVREAMLLSEKRRRYIYYENKLKKTERAIAEYIKGYVEGLFEDADTEKRKLKELRDLTEQLMKSLHKAAR